MFHLFLILDSQISSWLLLFLWLTSIAIIRFHVYKERGERIGKHTILIFPKTQKKTLKWKPNKPINPIHYCFFNVRYDYHTISHTLLSIQTPSNSPLFTGSIQKERWSNFPAITFWFNDQLTRNSISIPIDNFLLFVHNSNSSSYNWCCKYLFMISEVKDNVVENGKKNT